MRPSTVFKIDFVQFIILTILLAVFWTSFIMYALQPVTEPVVHEVPTVWELVKTVIMVIVPPMLWATSLSSLLRRVGY